MTYIINDTKRTSIDVFDEFPHLIHPRDVNIHERLLTCLVVSLHWEQNPKKGVTVLRTVLVPENGATQFYLSQHLSEYVAPVMGTTAFVHSPDRADIEATIARNGRIRFLKHAKAMRGDNQN
jgi:hypothetical protein